MKYKETYTFLEEFLRWNFDKLPPIQSDTIYGSPSFAMHLWINLMKLRVDADVSIVLFDDPAYEAHKDALEEFLAKRCHNILDVPTHFVVSVQDKDFQVHFDSRGDITEGFRRIRSIHTMDGHRTSKYNHRKRVAKVLHGQTVLNVKTVMGRMGKMYMEWLNVPGSKDLWHGFTPYHELLAPSGKAEPDGWGGRKKTKRTLRNI